MRRFDQGTIKSYERIAGGALKIEAAMTRAGVFEYVGSDGEPFREYRAPDDVLVEDSYRTLEHAALTIGHPKDLVSPENYETLSKGHVSPGLRVEDGHIVGSVIVASQEAIDMIESGIRELSCGYECQLDLTPGVTDAGEPYDARQTNVRYNHLALVKYGRAGSSVALRLDSQGDQTMELEELIALVQSLSQELAALKAAVEELAKPSEEDPAPEEPPRDAEEEDPKSPDEDEVKRDELVARRVALIDKARGFGVRADAKMSDRDLKIAIVATSGVNASAFSDAELDGAVAVMREDSIFTRNVIVEDEEDRYPEPHKRVVKRGK